MSCCGGIVTERSIAQRVCCREDMRIVAGIAVKDVVIRKIMLLSWGMRYMKSIDAGCVLPRGVRAEC